MESVCAELWFANSEDLESWPNRLGDMNLRQISELCAILTLALCHAACSSSPQADEIRKPVHPVKGKVLVQGKPAAGAFVLFIPVNEPPNGPDPRPRAEAAP